MKILDTQFYDAEELSVQELTEIIGGNWWSDFKEGFRDGLQFCKDTLEALRDIIR